MAKHWERIVELRERLRKQAEATLHQRQRALGEVESALNDSLHPSLLSAHALRRREALRDMLVRQERALLRQLIDDKAKLLDAGVAAKQATYLQEQEAHRQRVRTDKVEQNAIEDWHRSQRGRNL